MRIFRLLAWLVTLLLPSSGLAQTNAAALEGCFTFETGPYEGDPSYVPDARYMLQDVRLLQPADSGRLILLDEPQFSDLSSWEVISADSAIVSFGYGFSGIVVRLELTDGILHGVGTMWSDRSDAIGRVAIRGRSIDCSQRERASF